MKKARVTKARVAEPTSTKISVVIPCYNQARYLSRAIESVLAQTHDDVEVIVVNDGSTDATDEVASRYADEHSLRYIRQNNRGLPAARNAGIVESTGNYIGFLDADDYLHPTKLALQAQILDDTPSLGWVYCDITTVGENCEPVEEQSSVGDARRRLSGDVFPSLMLGGYFPPHTVLVRRSALNEVGLFDVELGGYADYDLWLRLSARGYSAYYLDEKLAYYRRHAKNMSSDGEHMAATRRRCLVKMAHLDPIRVGETLAALQDRNQELYESNRWLRGNWEEVLARARDAEWSSDADRAYSFVSRFKQGKLLAGEPDQAAIWEADIADEPAKAIYLQPPAQLSFRIDGGGPGRLSFAIATHPDCWSNPQSGGCQFIVLVNQGLAFMASIDPTHNAPDRRWHRFELDVPAAPNDVHEVVLETRSVGPTRDFRWALWRAPRFIWADDPGSENETSPAGELVAID